MPPSTKPSTPSSSCAAANIVPEEFEELVVYGCTISEIAAWYRCRVSDIRARLKDPVLREIWKNAPLRRQVLIKRMNFRHAEKSVTIARSLGCSFLGQYGKARAGADETVEFTMRTGISRDPDDSQDQG